LDAIRVRAEILDPCPRGCGLLVDQAKEQMVVAPLRRFGAVAVVLVPLRSSE
jgi:hypothetical protein